MSSKYELKEMDIQKVPFTSIIGHTDFNIRDKDSDSFKDEYINELADEIEQNGQFTPMIVKPILEGKDIGKLLLIAGYRRAKAFRVIANRQETKYNEAVKKAEADGKDASKVEKPLPLMVKVSLLPANISAIDLEFINANENLQRQDLSSYDLAKKFAKWKLPTKQGGLFELSARMIAERLHSENGRQITVPYINNLARAYTNCIPKIHNLWKVGKLPLTTIFDLASEEDKVKQELMLDALMGLEEAKEKLAAVAREEGGKGEGGNTPEKPRGRGRKQLEELRVHLHDADVKREIGAEGIRWALNVLNYALGDMDEVKAAATFLISDGADDEGEDESKNGKKGKKAKKETRAEA